MDVPASSVIREMDNSLTSVQTTIKRDLVLPWGRKGEAVCPLNGLLQSQKPCSNSLIFAQGFRLCDCLSSSADDAPGSVSLCLSKTDFCLSSSLSLPLFPLNLSHCLQCVPPSISPSLFFPPSLSVAVCLSFSPLSVSALGGWQSNDSLSSRRGRPPARA